MRKTISTFVALAAATALFAAPAYAQTTMQTGKGGGGSPHVKSAWTIGATNISIEYGRPSLKGRAEALMMPVGKPWRTGADEGTVITIDKPLKFGANTLAPGSYTISTQPGDKEWLLLIGKLGAPKQWGIPYKPELEMFKVPMTLGKTATPVEMVTYSIDKTEKGGTLRIEWGTVSVTTPFTM